MFLLMSLTTQRSLSLNLARTVATRRKPLMAVPEMGETVKLMTNQIHALTEGRVPTPVILEQEPTPMLSQKESRIHRIGLVRTPMRTYHLKEIEPLTMEEKLIRLLEGKRKLLQTILMYPVMQKPRPSATTQVILQMRQTPRRLVALLSLVRRNLLPQEGPLPTVTTQTPSVRTMMDLQKRVLAVGMISKRDRIKVQTHLMPATGTVVTELETPSHPRSLYLMGTKRTPLGTLLSQEQILEATWPAMPPRQ